MTVFNETHVQPALNIYNLNTLFNKPCVKHMNNAFPKDICSFNVLNTR